ncbi:MAG: hypothetical protein ACRDOO_09245 [Actinomadura sp.]
MWFWRPDVRVVVALPLFVMADVQVKAHDLIADGRTAEAARLLRKDAGLRRGEVREAVEVLRAGGVLPEWPLPGKADLAKRVAALKAAGQRKFLVRIEREMDAADAEDFVDSI